MQLRLIITVSIVVLSCCEGGKRKYDKLTPLPSPKRPTGEGIYFAGDPVEEQTSDIIALLPNLMPMPGRPMTHTLDTTLLAQRSEMTPRTVVPGANTRPNTPTHDPEFDLGVWPSNPTSADTSIEENVAAPTAPTAPTPPTPPPNKKRKKDDKGKGPGKKGRDGPSRGGAGQGGGQGIRA